MNQVLVSSRFACDPKKSFDIISKEVLEEYTSTSNDKTEKLFFGTLLIHFFRKIICETSYLSPHMYMRIPQPEISGVTSRRRSDDLRVTRTCRSTVHTRES